MAIHRNHSGTFPTVYTVNGCLQSACSGGGQNLLTVTDKGKGNLRMCQCLKLHRTGDPTSLYGIGLHKLHSGRRVKKQIPNDDGSSVRTACFGFLQNIATFQM